MRIFIDIGHPAHVHYFRNFIKIMESKGHKFFITARDKEMTHYLLNHYNIKFVSRGKGGKGTLGKIFNIIKTDYYMYKLSKRFDPNIFLSFGSLYTAHVSKLLRKYHIAFDDTEHAKYEHMLYVPFTDEIYTPKWFFKNFGTKHKKFNGLMELTYLHPKYFQPNESILDTLNLSTNEPFVIIRFVSWNASHDIGESGLTKKMKYKLVKELSFYAKVFISSEGDIPTDLNQYSINIPPEKMHDVLAFASLYIGESPTMTTESALLGTPAICISSWACNCGNFRWLKKYDLIYCFEPNNENYALDKAISILKDNRSKMDWLENKNKYLNHVIDVNKFIINKVENY